MFIQMLNVVTMSSFLLQPIIVVSFKNLIDAKLAQLVLDKFY